MSGGSYALVMVAALLHAAWNAALRGGEDRARSVGWMSIATCLFALPWLPFVSFPGSAAMPYLLASSVVHNVYLELLVLAYRQADLGAAYPIARGTSPLLVCLGGWVLAGEHLTVLSALGVGLITAGIFAIARDRLRLDRQAVLVSLATGGCIAMYSVLDGLGARHSPDSLSYNAWLFATYGTFMSFRFVFRERRQVFSGDRRQIGLAMLSAVVSIFAYGLVTLAMRQGTLGLVSALRETSVVFAALMGRFFLREVLPFRRLAACVVIALGAVILAL